MQMINHKPCRFRIPAYTLWLCLAAPSLCYANIGVPMIFVTLPMMVVALLPIIIIETVLATPYLKIPFRFLLRLIARANLFSTFVGIPITWFLLVVLERASGGGGASNLNVPESRLLAVTRDAPWLVPYEKQLFWMVPTAQLVLLIPFFFASWWVEYFIIRRDIFNTDWDTDKRTIRRAVRNINFVSYSGLAIYILVRMYLR